MTPAGFLATWGPGILSIVAVLAGGGLLKVIFDRKLNRATATLTTANAGKTRVEGEVAQSGDYRAWAEQAMQRAKDAEVSAKDARDDADASRRSARDAEDAATRCRADAQDLREQLDELNQLIRECARSGCPVRPLLPPATREDDPMPPSQT